MGFEYNAGCWQVRAVAHRFITATQQYSTSFQIQLELSGLSRIGINPLETLRQNISGYHRTDEIASMKSASLRIRLLLACLSVASLGAAAQRRRAAGACLAAPAGSSTPGSRPRPRASSRSTASSPW